MFLTRILVVPVLVLLQAFALRTDEHVISRSDARDQLHAMQKDKRESLGVLAHDMPGLSSLHARTHTHTSVTPGPAPSAMAEEVSGSKHETSAKASHPTNSHSSAKAHSAAGPSNVLHEMVASFVRQRVQNLHHAALEFKTAAKKFLASGQRLLDSGMPVWLIAVISIASAAALGGLGWLLYRFYLWKPKRRVMKPGVSLKAGSTTTDDAVSSDNSLGVRAQGSGATTTPLASRPGSTQYGAGSAARNIHSPAP